MRHLPNAITVARLGSVPVLLALARYEKETAFAVLLFIALGSDVIDGWLARTLRVVSPAGAMLDSIAESLRSVAFHSVNASAVFTTASHITISQLVRLI